MLKETIEQYKNVIDNTSLSRKEKIEDLGKRSILLVSILKQKFPDVDIDTFLSNKVKDVLPEVFEISKKCNVNINDEQFIYIIPDEMYKKVMSITFFNVWNSLIEDLDINEKRL